ncbi:hypothetical protein SUGI_0056000 [Cryptomeria japonica]|uniref:indole-3-glycerol phosphate synthase, chloroplastic n=1 Tax=Cryptomeria japonica TaxID=3369 RepID=UPI0024089FB7|nr:indole-3-glycerol phosphate synthase, chloroplastic [Cryptomeria japonica]GLJ07031.1 hypothetical protein SUGI_0056000 [Cryptomeria japonica]
MECSMRFGRLRGMDHLNVRPRSTAINKMRLLPCNAHADQRYNRDEGGTSMPLGIRRRPSTGPPLHYVGPFEFRLQNEGNTPRNLLEEIVWNKDKEIWEMKERRPLASLKRGMTSLPPRDFIGALKAREAETGMPALIAELKKTSPFESVLQPNFNAAEIAQAYENGGAACISVWTDSKYYQGSFEDLQAVRDAGIKCPLLCKEFIIDAWQIYYARLKGADAVLLMASILPDLDIKYMTKICKVLGMAALVEVSNVRELDRVLEISGIELIGIQSRNLETFEVDVNMIENLLQGERLQRICDRDIIVVAESSPSTNSDIALVQSAGARAVLAGEYLVKQNNPAAAIAELFGKDISIESKTEAIVA